MSHWCRATTNGLLVKFVRYNAYYTSFELIGSTARVTEVLNREPTVPGLAAVSCSASANAVTVVSEASFLTAYLRRHKPDWPLIDAACHLLDPNYRLPEAARRTPAPLPTKSLTRTKIGLC
jgi:hypothetical protein